MPEVLIFIWFSYIYYITWHIIEACFYILLATSNKIVFFIQIELLKVFSLFPLVIFLYFLD